MAIIEVDVSPVIERLIKMINFNPLLVDKENPEGKFRKVIYGTPPGDDRADENPPYCFVTVPSNPQESREPIGDGAGESTIDRVIMNYHIVIVDQKDDSASVQKSLHGFVKLVSEMIRNNPKLKDPATSLDPKCTRSTVVSTPRFDPTIGSDLDSMTVLVQCEHITS